MALVFTQKGSGASVNLRIEEGGTFVIVLDERVRDLNHEMDILIKMVEAGVIDMDDSKGLCC